MQKPTTLKLAAAAVIAAAYAKMLQDKRMCDVSKIRHVLYTPLEYTFKYDPANAAAFLGTADPWCVPEEVIRMAKERKVPMHVYEAANHSLETGNVTADIEILKDVMRKTETFIIGV